jgi:hypothetical protein
MKAISVKDPNFGRDCTTLRWQARHGTSDGDDDELDNVACQFFNNWRGLIRRAGKDRQGLPAAEALSLQVIDTMADDVPDLLRKIDGRTVMVAGKPQRLTTAD